MINPQIPEAMRDLHDINPLPIILWPESDINAVLDEIFTDPIFDDIN